MSDTGNSSFYFTLFPNPKRQEAVTKGPKQANGPNGATAHRSKNVKRTLKFTISY